MSALYGSGIRRLPIYILADCSEAMAGKPIESVRSGLRSLLSSLLSDPWALESVWLSVITFATDIQQVVALTEIAAFQEPRIRAAGTASLGEGLELLMNCLDREVRKTTANEKGDFNPLVIIVTNGAFTDSWEAPADELKKRRACNIVVVCDAGPDVTRLCNSVIRLQSTGWRTRRRPVFVDD